MRASLTGLASIVAAILATIAALTISGCGLKGDLYLPQDETAATTPATPTTPNRDGEEREEDEQQPPPSSTN